MVVIICVDGPISAGISTFIRQLFAAYQENDRVVVLEEPHTAIAQFGHHNTLDYIGSSPAITQLFIIQRLAAYYRQIIATLPANTILIVDRYITSQIVFFNNLYINSKLTAFEKDYLREAYREELETLPLPDAILFVRRELPTCLANLRFRNRASEKWLTDTVSGVTYLAGLVSSYREAETMTLFHAWKPTMLKGVNTHPDSLHEDFNSLLQLTLQACPVQMQLPTVETISDSSSSDEFPEDTSMSSESNFSELSTEVQVDELDLTAAVGDPALEIGSDSDSIHQRCNGSWLRFRNQL